MENLKKEEDEVKQPVVPQDEGTQEPQGQDVPEMGGNPEPQGEPNAEGGDTRTPGEMDESAQGEGIADDSQGAPAQQEMGQGAEPTFTQSQVNELVGRARKEGRESAMKALREQYGVKDDNELSDLFGRGQSYDDINFELETSNKELAKIKGENALLQSGIDPERWDDAKAILGAKGLEISLESLNAMLPTHPEWIKGGAAKGALSEEDMQQMGQGTPQPKPAPAVAKLGNEPTPQQPESDVDIASKLFGFDLRK